MVCVITGARAKLIERLTTFSFINAAPLFLATRRILIVVGNYPYPPCWRGRRATYCAALQAMVNQRLDKAEILNVRWAEDDPNPGAKRRKQVSVRVGKWRHALLK